MKNKYWSGIGSRHDITDEIKKQQREIGYQMSQKGWSLISGGASGSDFNFLYGASKGRDINLPVVVRPVRYRSYTGSYGHSAIVEMMEDAEFEVAKAYFFKHEIFTEEQFNKMPEVAQVLHARNYYQIFDWHGNVRVKFVAYAAPENRWGVVSGGTRTAIAIARIEKVPVFNIKLKGQYSALQEFIGRLPNVR
ncbi:DprA-like DNA recombination-mediator protein [Colwellia phage 9A]|uniref:Uncharacterized protein n=1 Tax=Colwellia phage 9A TaxID=765765 RepID=I3UMI5_9CAUD|nr:DprA-like DNA recombination-mediator protein [Colwellia phage 9A]AFK66700.1 hypothetical protein COPG_00104 [Colwellia phage 9A]